MSKGPVMGEVAIGHPALARGPLALAGNGDILALIGAVGAGVGVYAMGAFLAPASLPLSVLGLVLGVRRRRFLALCLGTFGIVCAIIVLANTPGFWFLLEVIGVARPN